MTQTPPDYQLRDRYRIYSEITRSAILHIEDALDIGKLRLLAFQYERGKGASAQAIHYLDVEDARVLCYDLASGRMPEPFTDYKGSPQGHNGAPQSRVLKVEDRGDKARNPIVIELTNGPGQIVGEGAIKPVGEPEARIAIFLSRWNARRLALAVGAYLQAWETATFRRRQAVQPAVREPESPAEYALREDLPEVP